MAERRTFEVGFVLAGAVSAGCYSAGVMDFMIEALDDYYAERDKEGWDGPTHDVRVPVLAGASAGGMTAGMTALHLFRPLAHVRPGEPPPAARANRLYSSWVTDIDIRALLATTDFDADEKGLRSALCSAPLERILADAFAIDGDVRTRPWVGRGDDGAVQVMMTLTNLRGVPYSFDLIGAGVRDAFGMLNHADVVSFRVGPAAAGDGRPLLDVANTGDPSWALFKAAALATGAFPIGLAPRPIARPAEEFITSGAIGFRDPRTGRFTPVPPDARFIPTGDFQYWAVDGGTMNNEPIEQARRFLQNDGSASVPGGARPERTDGVGADHALVLVAPFPNFKALEDNPKKGTLAALLPKLMSALINQARFKPEELVQARDPTNFSRFIVSPAREGPGRAAPEFAIASGALAGFSGFLDPSFRRHDYLLGRRNAQAFLRWTFALPRTHPLFEGCDIGRNWVVRDASRETGTLPPGSDTPLRPKAFLSGPGMPNRVGYPIIPLTPRMQVPIDIPDADVPKPPSTVPDDLRGLIKRRAGAVVGALVDVDLAHLTADLGWPVGPLVRASAKRYGAHVVEKKAAEVIGTAMGSLKKSFP